MEPDFIKIDGSFSERLASNADNQYLIRSLIEMAEKFGMKTIAEWVQTEEDADYLRQWGVDYLQGNFFGSANMTLPWKAPEAEEAAMHEVQPQPNPMIDETPAEKPPAQHDLDRPGLDRLRAALSTLDETFHRPAGQKPRPHFADVLGGDSASSG